MDSSIYLTFLLTAGFFFFVAKMRPATGDATSLAPIEKRVDALLKNAGIRYDPVSSMPAGVQDALTNGNKIEAIKLYRDATGVGLKEAKDAVEQTGGGTQRIVAKLDALMKGLGVKYDPAAGGMAAVDDAIRAGNTIEAIKLYRTATGAGLKEAKDAVEARMKGFT